VRLFRTFAAFFLAGAVFSFPLGAGGKEIPLFDESGEAVAYIDETAGRPVYLWGGKAVAYLVGDSVYGFNGKHLGWFTGGLVLDHRGFTVGFAEGAIDMVTKPERPKGLKEFPPAKAPRQPEPPKPKIRNRFSPPPLGAFLAAGRGSPVDAPAVPPPQRHPAGVRTP
jgi:hypothetical protein